MNDEKVVLIELNSDNENEISGKVSQLELKKNQNAKNSKVIFFRSNVPIFIDLENVQGFLFKNPFDISQKEKFKLATQNASELIKQLTLKNRIEIFKKLDSLLDKSLDFNKYQVFKIDDEQFKKNCQKLKVLLPKVYENIQNLQDIEVLPSFCGSSNLCIKRHRECQLINMIYCCRAERECLNFCENMNAAIDKDELMKFTMAIFKLDKKKKNSEEESGYEFDSDEFQSLLNEKRNTLFFLRGFLQYPDNLTCVKSLNNEADLFKSAERFLYGQEFMDFRNNIIRFKRLRLLLTGVWYEKSKKQVKFWANIEDGLFNLREAPFDDDDDKGSGDDFKNFISKKIKACDDNVQQEEK